VVPDIYQQLVGTNVLSWLVNAETAAASAAVTCVVQ
jgi:hypothetical protein